MAYCPSCGSKNPDGNKFCSNCGAHLSTACQKCRYENSPTSIFCSQCGSKLKHPEPAPKQTPQSLSKLISEKSKVKPDVFPKESVMNSLKLRSQTLTLTNYRIIVETQGVFAKRVKDMSYHSIQSVAYTKKLRGGIILACMLLVLALILANAVIMVNKYGGYVSLGVITLLLAPFLGFIPLLLPMETVQVIGSGQTLEFRGSTDVVDSINQQRSRYYQMMQVYSEK
ncbi:MAG: zinc ribbon domain-containing protein [Candidatus Altiarchaeota archaeon]|nr:zinc ribbon domain-containing protein [Candidatus Altiarchaeota archaeon]